MPGVPQSLVGCALLASETAADIARRCRSDTRLLSLLVQEKCGDDANHSRFARDFKTLADVLVQSVVAKRLGQQFPELNDSVYGEENDTIQNNLGRDVTIRVGDTVDETLECLCEALDNDLESARSLAEAAHRQFTVDQLNVDSVPPDNEVLDLTKVGIWIDPIDSTNEYISGNVEAENEFGFHSSGLHCVTINIGVFDKETGRPLAGVINQPFYTRDADKRWSGRCYWALCNQQQKGLHSLPAFVNENTPDVIVTSSSECEAVTTSLRQSGYTVLSAAGAGYKLLCVALGTVRAYVLTKDSTFAWDTCAAHAMIVSLGGNACHCVRPAGPEPLTYSPKTLSGNRTYCNAAGIIASRQPQTVQKVYALING